MRNDLNSASIAERLRALRTARALTQEDLAGMAGVGVATIQRAERGARLSADTVASLAAALDLDARELTGPVEQCDLPPHVALDPVTTGRQLVDLLVAADRLDFGFAEIDEMDLAVLVESFSDFCAPVGDGRVPSGPVARVAAEIEARTMLDSLAGRGLVVTGGSYELNCHEVDDEFGAGMPILLATWTDRVAAVRVGVGGVAIERAFPTDGLDRWESPGDGFVFPATGPQSAFHDDGNPS